MTPKHTLLSALLLFLAGLVSAAETRADAPIIPDVPEVTLTLPGRVRNLTWYTRTPGGAPMELCIAPCLAKLPVGDHQFGLQRGARDVIWDPTVYTVRGPTRLEGRYSSRRGLRFAGLGAIGGGIVGGLSFHLYGRIVGQACADECTPGRQRLGSTISALAIVVGVAAVVAGVVMLTRRDKVRFRGAEPAAVQPEVAQLEPGAPDPQPDYRVLNQAVWRCLRGANSEVATVRVVFDRDGKVEKTEVLDAPAAAACIDDVLSYRRVERAPMGTRTLRFRLPADGS